MKLAEDQKAHVEAWIIKWQPRLLLQNHKVTVCYKSRPCKKDKEKEIETFAETTTCYAGLDAKIDVFPAFWRSMVTEEAQERMILHELCHIVYPEADEPQIILLTQIVWNAFECTTEK